MARGVDIPLFNCTQLMYDLESKYIKHCVLTDLGEKKRDFPVALKQSAD